MNHFKAHNWKRRRRANDKKKERELTGTAVRWGIEVSKGHVGTDSRARGKGGGRGEKGTERKSGGAGVARD